MSDDDQVIRVKKGSRVTIIGEGPAYVIISRLQGHVLIKDTSATVIGCWFDQMHHCIVETWTSNLFKEAGSDNRFAAENGPDQPVVSSSEPG